MATVTAISPGDGATLSQAVAAFQRQRDLLARSQAAYQATFDRLLADLGDRRIGEVTSDELADFLTRWWGQAAPRTYNRHRAALASLWTWATRQGWAAHDVVAVIERRTQRRTARQEQQARAIAYDQLAGLWGDTGQLLRDRALWALLYESAARAEEALALDVADVDLAERTAVITGKGGGIERIYWATATARLLDRYLAGRTSGPAFLTQRRPRGPMAAADTDPDSGRVRLSYRRAAEVFATASGGLTLHQLRHSALTHLAEAGVDATMLRAKSRHRGLRSLEPYVAPSDTAVRSLTDAHDPQARRR